MHINSLRKDLIFYELSKDYQFGQADDDDFDCENVGYCIEQKKTNRTTKDTILNKSMKEDKQNKYQKKQKHLSDLIQIPLKNKSKICYIDPIRDTRKQCCVSIKEDLLKKSNSNTSEFGKFP